MKKALAYIAAFFFTVCIMTAQNTEESIVNEVEMAEPTGDVPVMELESNTVDYGEVEKGSDPLRTVSFTNTGAAPLIIQKAKGSCGCTVPTWPKEPIMPGESSEIEIRYDTKRVGPIRKTVRITTNEGSDPHVLQVRGTVKKDASDGEALPKKETGLVD